MYKTFIFVISSVIPVRDLEPSLYYVATWLKSSSLDISVCLLEMILFEHDLNYNISKVILK